MRKLFLVISISCTFILSNTLFCQEQEYDVYVNYSFYSFDWNGSTGARTSLTNFRLFFPDGSQINFNRTFESSFIGPSTVVDGVFSGRTTSTTLTYLNNLYIHLYVFFLKLLVFFYFLVTC